MWLPPVRAAVVKLALALAFSGAVPSVAAPSKKVMVPVGSGAGLVLPVTCAVKVTLLPKVDGLGVLLMLVLLTTLAIRIRRSCCGAGATLPPAGRGAAPGRLARTPHRLPGAPVSVRVVPLTLQVVGVQVSNVMGVRPLLALAVRVSVAPLSAVAGGVKLID